jgi:uncharacterized membrane protein YphA (DoxX/SURF4 family)
MHRRFFELSRGLCLVLGLSITMASSAFAVSKRNADVVVVNNTGKTILQVTVAHKYSDVFSHDLEWQGILKSGDKTTGKVVEFNTGFGTTGRDWWYVSWVYTDGAAIHYSDPDNLRGAVDFMEKSARIGIPVGTAIAATVFGTVCTIGSAGTCGPAATAAVTTAMASVGATIASATAGELLANGGTKGFKQHILREDDAGKTIIIVLEKNGKISIKSPSGISETKYSKHEVSLTPSQQKKLDGEINAFKETKAPNLNRSWNSKYGEINFVTGNYGGSMNKTIKVTEWGWDVEREAVVASGVWGQKDAPLDPKKNGSFTFYFADKCSFTGNWLYMLPEFVNGKIKINEWNGDNPNCG